MSSKAFIEQLYRKILGRNSDSEGLIGWTNLIDNQDKNAFEVFQEFIQSTEFIDQVKPLFKLFYTTLARIPEVSSYDWWLETYREGESLEAIAHQLLGSDEFKNLYGDLNDDAFVTQLFQNAFDRAPDEAGKAYWLEQMQAGMSRSQVAISLANSSEFEAMRGQDAEIVLQYQSILSSNPSTAQLAAAKTLTSEQLTAQLFKTADYSGVDVPYLTDNGVVVDGYVAGATVFIDTDGDGVQGPNEPSVVTDAQGNFDFGDAATFGQLIMTGGTDISTGEAFEGSMTAPSGATVVNPVTTLIDSMTRNNIDKATTLDEAAQAVQQALGLDESIDLLHYDPISEASKADADAANIAQALALQKANTTINTLISQTAALLDGTGISRDEETAIQNAYTALGETLENADGTSVDLTSSGVVQAVIQDSATQAGADESQQNLIQTLAGDAATTITNLTKAIEQSDTNSSKTTEEILNDIAAIQIVSETIENQMEQGGQSGDVSATTNLTSGSNLDNAVSEAGKNVGDVDGDGDDDPDSNQPVNNGGSSPVPDTSGPIATLNYSTDIQSTIIPTDTTISVKPEETLRIFATFNEAIDETTGATISIGNVEFDLVSDAPMIKLDSTHYYYDAHIPIYNWGVEVVISTAQDSLGNVITQAPINDAFTIDNSAPSISSFSSTTADGSYQQGTTINITATADEVIQAGSVITITLDTEDEVILTAPSDGNTLTGSYIVGANDNSEDLTINSFMLGSVNPENKSTDIDPPPTNEPTGTVTDLAGNEMTSLSVPEDTDNLAGSHNIVIDTITPTVHQTHPISKDESGGSVAKTYDAGDTLTLKFSEAVQVSALTNATFEVSNQHSLGEGVAILPVGSETHTDTFTVSLGTGTDIMPGDIISLNNQAVIDKAGNHATTEATFTLPSFIPTVTSITITNANGSKNNTLNTGDVVSATVTLSKAVTVVGTPQLTLNIGGETVQANYASGSDSAELIFNYTITNETDSDGISIDANSLSLGEDSIRDSTTNENADLSHVAVSDNPNYKVDTTAPTVTNVSSTLANGTYTVGQTIPIDVTFSEPVTILGNTFPKLTLNISEMSSLVDYSSGSKANTLTFDYTVQDGDTSPDLDYVDTASLNLNVGSSAIRDAAGNNAVLTLPAPGTTGSLGANQAIVIDTAGPTAHLNSPITQNDVDNSGTYTEGDKLTIQFNEPVSVTSLGIDNISPTTNSLGTGVSLTPSNESAGYADTFDITLGTDPTLTGGETLTTTAANAVDAVDAAGNEAAANIDFTVPGGIDTSIVVFDLVNGQSSSHNGGGGVARAFETGVQYTIYIMLESNLTQFNTGNDPDAFKWTNANNLRDDDLIVFVGSNGPIDIVPGVTNVKGVADNNGQANKGEISIRAIGHSAFSPNIISEILSINQKGTLLRQNITGKRNQPIKHNTMETVLWSGSADNMGASGDHYLTTMPTGILTSQGLV